MPRDLSERPWIQAVWRTGRRSSTPGGWGVAPAAACYDTLWPGKMVPAPVDFLALLPMNLTVPVLVGLAKLISGATVRWIDSQPDTCQRVYFANHTSHLDALVLWASLPPDVRRLTRPVAANDYWERGPLRRYLASSRSTRC